MTEVSPFQAFGSTWRFGTTEDGRVFAVIGDIAKTLGHRSASDAARMLSEDEKGTRLVRTPGGDQRVLVAYEDGIWELIFLSRVEGAKAVKKRVKEILAEIRRTGSYSAISTAPAIPQTLSEALRLAADEHDRANAAEQKVAELAPKAAAADALMETEGAVSMGAVANAFGIGRTALFDMLRDEKIIQKDRRPYQEYAAWFRVTVRHYDDSNGVPRPYVNSRMHMAGALRLHALLTKRGRELRKPLFDNQLSLLDGGAA